MAAPLPLLRPVVEILWADVYPYRQSAPRWELASVAPRARFLPFTPTGRGSRD